MSCRDTIGTGSASIRSRTIRSRTFRSTLGSAALLVTVAPRTWAAGGAPMPWDTALQNLLGNLSGPTAQALVLMAIVACGLLWAFTRNEEGLKRLGQVAFGGAVAMGAVALMANLGFAGATI